jgi:hypothetical protein
MSGAAGRRKGHDWERSLARYLSDRLDMTVVTARSLGGGVQVAADLASVVDREALLHVHGWTIEAKARGNRSVPAWLRQAHAAAVNDGVPLYVAIHQRAGGAHEEADVWMPRVQWWSVANGLPALLPQAEPIDPVCISLAAWVEVVLAYGRPAE